MLKLIQIAVLMLTTLSIYYKFIYQIFLYILKKSILQLGQQHGNIGLQQK